jgi:hypothetical protein
MRQFFLQHTRFVLTLLLVPIAFGCQPKHLNDLELSERMTSGSTDRAGIILLVNGSSVQGFFVALHGDSLEYHEGATMLTKQHTIAADSVQKVIVQGPTPYWAPVFGLGGCALGGCSACFVVAGSDGRITTSKVVTGMAIGAVAGAAAGYGIGLLSDPGKAENAWVYKIRKHSK